MALTFTASARRIGTVSAVGTAVLSAAYAATLVAGLLTLHSPQQPIADPLFSILEILIILAMPPMVALIVTVHAWAPAETKVCSLIAIVFASLLAGLGAVIASNIQLRMIGVVGYAGVFPVAALLLAVLFQRATPREASEKPGTKYPLIS